MTTTKKMTADDARTLLQGTTPGPWHATGPWSDEDDEAISYDICGDAERLGEVRSGAADARLMAAAPDLAAAVIALEGERDEARAEVERLRAKLAGAHETMMHQLTAQAAECERDLAEERAEAARLRAIIEGRTTPPTDEEITAHAAAGGSWVVGVRPVHTAREAREVRDVCERRAVLHEETPPGWPPYRWLAFDDHGRPCAWPTVTP